MTTRLFQPAYPGAPPRHYVVRFGRFKGQKLSTLPGWYLRWLLARPRLDETLRALIFETIKTSADRRHALDEATFTHAVRLQKPNADTSITEDADG